MGDSDEVMIVDENALAETTTTSTTKRAFDGSEEEKTPTKKRKVGDPVRYNR